MFALVSALLVLQAVLIAEFAGAQSAPQSAKIATAPIPNQYIITLKDEVADVPGLANALSQAHGGKVLHVYSKALKGFAITVPDAAADVLKKHPLIARVEQDATVTIVETQNGATWGLDRIDQRALPLSSSYTYENTGAGVHAYIVDTGIRASHSEFSGRVGNGYSSILDGNGTNDCNGHGTHVAGTVGGTTYGVAKGVTLHAVRVLNCQGSGTWSGVIAGIDWVAGNRVLPAVANMSLGGGYSASVNDAVQRAINAGVTFAVAAGNSNADACTSSPSSAPNALTVGATQSNDTRASFSNWGTCVDLFAPGSNITSAYSSSDTSTAIMSGTSMASPHVAGVAALYLASNPSATPTQVGSAVIGNATSNALSSLNTGSPNLLLYSLFGVTTPEPEPEPIPGEDTQAPSTPTNTRVSFVAQGASVAWNASTDTVGVTEYLIYRNNAYLGSATSLSYVDATAQTGATYTYTVSAKDAAGNESGKSAGATITMPQVTISHSVTNITRNGATINWSTNYLSTGTVTILRNGNVIATINSNTAKTSHSVTVTGLSRWTRYDYQINASRSGGSGSASASGSFRTRW